MRCTAVENLLPLYAGGDLAEDKMRTVRAHLSSCDACRRTEEDFRASQSLLRSFSAPEFGEEFYESIRGAVMTELTAHATARASFFQTLRTLLLSRPAVTAALASLIICAALFFAIYRQLPSRDAHLVTVENGARDINPNQYAKPYPLKGSNAPIIRPNVKRERQSNSASVVPVRENLPPVNQRGVKPEGVKLERTDGASTVARMTGIGNGGAGYKATPAQAVARIEIQTSDPNIRIIWLGR